MRILVDAMGGDNAPHDIVKGCLEAVKAAQGFDIELIGDKTQIEHHLGKEGRANARIHVTHSSEIITNDDKPTDAIKKKKDSSMVVGFNKLKQHEGQVFISAGSTGALMAGSLLLVGRIPGVIRPALAPLVPSKSGQAMIIDAGMNTQVKAENYLQFGIMGSIYMQEVHGIQKPRVGLVNVGTEESKGNPLVREGYELLKGAGLNFIGNIEGRDIATGSVDVAVCDGFTGNAMLKMMEGTGKFFMESLKGMYTKSIFTKLAALVMKGELHGLKKKLDPEEIGGTPILGVDGMIYKCHGNSKSKAIKNTILRARTSASSTMADKLRDAFAAMDTGGDYD